VGDHIDLVGIEVFAHHGVYPEEREQGQPFVIDVRLGVDLGAAGSSDDLEDTVDYGVLVQLIHDVVAGERWHLIERVAQRVAEAVLEEPRVSAVTVTVHKPLAPVPVKVADVAVTLTRSGASQR
jgi:dihydroneopterin aldolase